MLPVDKETVDALMYIGAVCRANGVASDMPHNPLTLQRFIENIYMRQQKFGIHILTNPAGQDGDPSGAYSNAAQYANFPVSR